MIITGSLGSTDPQSHSASKSTYQSHSSSTTLTPWLTNRMPNINAFTPPRSLHLRYSSNSVHQLRNLQYEQHLIFILAVDVSRCRLEVLEGIELCVSLQWLDASFNLLQRIPARLQHLTKLWCCNFEGNRISHPEDLSNLQDSAITCIRLLNNPIANFANYRLFVANYFARIIVVDDFVVSAAELTKGAKPSDVYGTQSSIFSVPTVFWSWPGDHKSLGLGSCLAAKMRLAVGLSMMCPCRRIQVTYKHYSQQKVQTSIHKVCTKLQAQVRGFLLRCKIRREIRNIEAEFRLKKYEFCPHTAAVLIQSIWRKHLIRKAEQKGIAALICAGLALRNWIVAHVAANSNRRPHVPLKLLVSDIAQDVASELLRKRFPSINLAFQLYPTARCYLDSKCQSWAFVRNGSRNEESKRRRGLFDLGSLNVDMKQMYKSLKRRGIGYLQHSIKRTGRTRSAASKLSLWSVCRSTTQALTARMLVRIEQLFRYNSIPSFWEHKVSSAKSILMIQTRWRGTRVRLVLVPLLQLRLVRRRASIAIQRWWRVNRGMLLRFQILRDITSHVRDIQSRTLYLEADLMFLIVVGIELPSFTKSFPEWKCTYDVDDGFLYSRKLGQACSRWGVSNHLFWTVRKVEDENEITIARKHVHNSNSRATNVVQDYGFSSTSCNLTQSLTRILSSGCAIKPIKDEISLTTPKRNPHVDEDGQLLSIDGTNLVLLQLTFRSVEEAQRRAATVMLLTTDTSGRYVRLLTADQILERITKTSHPEIISTRTKSQAMYHLTQVPRAIQAQRQLDHLSLLRLQLLFEKLDPERPFELNGMRSFVDIGNGQPKSNTLQAAEDVKKYPANQLSTSTTWRFRGLIKTFSELLLNNSMDPCKPGYDSKDNVPRAADTHRFYEDEREWDSVERDVTRYLESADAADSSFDSLHFSCQRKRLESCYPQLEERILVARIEKIRVIKLLRNHMTTVKKRVRLLRDDAQQPTYAARSLLFMRKANATVHRLQIHSLRYALEMCKRHDLQKRQLLVQWRNQDFADSLENIHYIKENYAACALDKAIREKRALIENLMSMDENIYRTHKLIRERERVNEFRRYVQKSDKKFSSTFSGKVATLEKKIYLLKSKAARASEDRKVHQQVHQRKLENTQEHNIAIKIQHSTLKKKRIAASLQRVHLQQSLTARSREDWLKARSRQDSRRASDMSDFEDPSRMKTSISTVSNWNGDKLFATPVAPTTQPSRTQTSPLMEARVYSKFKPSLTHSSRSPVDGPTIVIPTKGGERFDEQSLESSLLTLETR